MAKQDAKGSGRRRRRRDEADEHHDVDAEPLDTTVRVSRHPRARRQISAAKAWAGLIVFALVQYLCLKEGMSFLDAGARALGAGIAAYLIAWAVAVVIWRQLILAEVELLRRELLEAAERAAAEQAQRAPDEPASGAAPEPSPTF